MKSRLITHLVAAIGLGFAGAASAADGTINFAGKLTGQTCKITVNGVDSSSPSTVILPTVSTGKLTTAGQTAGQTGFLVALSRCVGAAKTAAVFFESGVTVDQVTGNLKNMSTDAGSAQNVQLQLVDSSNGKPVKAGDTSQHMSTTHVALTAEGTASMPYAVQYYAMGPTSPGPVLSSVTYAIDYQ